MQASHNFKSGSKESFPFDSKERDPDARMTQDNLLETRRSMATVVES